MSGDRDTFEVIGMGIPETLQHLLESTSLRNMEFVQLHATGIVEHHDRVDGGRAHGPRSSGRPGVRYRCLRRIKGGGFACQTLTSANG